MTSVPSLCHFIGFIGLVMKVPAFTLYTLHPTPRLCRLIALYLHRNLIGTSSEPDRNLIGTSPKGYRRNTEATPKDHRGIYKGYITFRTARQGA